MHCSVEHIGGWKENPQLSDIPFGPDYRDPKLWKPIWPKQHAFRESTARPEHFRRMFEAWELSEAEAAGATDRQPNATP